MEDKLASEQIDDIITLYGGWKAEVLSQLRSIIKATDPEVVEEVKWKMRTRPEGLPVWSHDGIVCMVETFNNDMKLVFPKGPHMEHLQNHFNARLNSSAVRAIEFRESDAVDESVIRKLVTEAVRLNKIKAGKD